MSAEDYTGATNVPAYPSVQGPFYLSYYTKALDANRIDYDVYDVDRRDRRSPDWLGVLSHYKVVIWYTANDFVTREPFQVAGTGTSRLALDEPLDVRHFMNEGGKLSTPASSPARSTPTASRSRTTASARRRTACAARTCRSSTRTTRARPTAASRTSTTSSSTTWGRTGTSPAATRRRERRAAADGRPRRRSVQWPGLDVRRYRHRERHGELGHVRGHELGAGSRCGIRCSPTRSRSPVGGGRAGRFNPFTGSFYMAAGADDQAYKRLRRTVDLTGVTAAQAPKLSFMTSYDLEADYDYMFVEAHTVGQDNWTTLPDTEGNTSRRHRPDCFAGLQPARLGGLTAGCSRSTLLTHYQTKTGPTSCNPTGTTGSWNAATASRRLGAVERRPQRLRGSAGRAVDHRRDGPGFARARRVGRRQRGSRPVPRPSPERDVVREAERRRLDDRPAARRAPTNPENGWAQRGQEFFEGGVVTTDDSVYTGFAFEDINASARNEFMGARSRTSASRPSRCPSAAAAAGRRGPRPGSPASPDAIRPGAAKGRAYAKLKGSPAQGPSASWRSRVAIDGDAGASVAGRVLAREGQGGARPRAVPAARPGRSVTVNLRLSRKARSNRSPPPSGRSRRRSSPAAPTAAGWRSRRASGCSSSR